MSELHTFAGLGVPSSIADALELLGITTPTPIQEATLPDSISGRDVLGRGRTGSGKTYAFLLPIITHIITDRYRPAPGSPRALILAPTRELVSQIEESLQPLKKIAKFTSFTIFGGVGQGPQVRAVNRGLDIAIATPGRLEDLMRQGEIDLSQIETVVIDEADQMADMGFLPIVTKILNQVPRDAQHLLFSATLDKQVKTLVNRFLTNPVTHEADSPEDTEAAHLQMAHHALRVSHEDKPGVIADLCAAPSRAIVFARTKHGARNLSRKLTKMGVPALELHGNLSQNARMRNLNAFHDGKVSTLVATDIAARGIHVDDVEIVIHADPPAEHKAYVHRSGRTARAGNSGVVVTIVRKDQVKDVKSLMGKAGVHAEWANATPESDLLFDLAPGGREFLDRSIAERMVQDVIPSKPSGGGGRGQKRSKGQGGKRNGGFHKSNKTQSKAHKAKSKHGGGKPHRHEGTGTGPGAHQNSRSKTVLLKTHA
ncbi:DEAD/DEAH box helicase [Stomatohabitans albus]|uniref:DEAD/DEAH box helicase n=1 Tax=Stomatohabitans albus TaxID=3110766 RepID=UPI00300C9969